MNGNIENEPLLREDSELQDDGVTSLDSVNLQNSDGAPEQEGDEKKAFSCRLCFLKCLQGITIEPVLFLNLMAWSIQSTVTTNLLLDKVCREQQFNESICANLSSHPDEQAIVQRTVTNINMYIEILLNIPGVFFVLFLGSWSDRHGRKIPLALPITGSFLATLLYMMNAYWVELPSLYILVTCIPRALTGGFITLIMAAYSYIADITKIRARTTRIAIMDLLMILGAPLGLLMSDLIFYRLGYIGIYTVSGLIFLLDLSYIIIRVEETRGPSSKYRIEAGELSHRPQNVCKDLFDTENVKKTFEVVARPRPNKVRTKMLLLMFAMCCMVFAFGTMSIGYLYTKRKFGWDYNQYVQLGLAEIFIGIMGNSFMLPVLSYHLQVDDSILGILGSLSKMGGLLLMGFAPYWWCLYLSSFVSCFGSMPIIVTRSTMSKLVPEGELGKVFSMLASWESVIPIISNPLYTVIYNSTIYDFPGAIYIISTGIYILPGIIFTWMYFNKSTEQLETHIHEETNVPDI